MGLILIRVICVICGLGVGSVAAQTAVLDRRQTLNYAFASPNTRENLTIDEAIKGLNSPEETEFIKRVPEFGCRVRSKLSVMRALGSWSDGAEHSVMLRVTADEANIRYLLSRLGQSANQKAVLYFRDQHDGPGSIYILRPLRRTHNLKTASALLDRAGIAFRTLVPTKNGVMVYIVDLKNELKTKVTAAARRLRARLQSRRGRGEFIGDDSDRQKGQLVFQQEIKDFEAKHPKVPPSCIEGRR